LREAIGKQIRYFAFPFGMPQNLNARAVQLAHDHDYLGVCSAYGDYNFPGDNPFHIRRIHADDMLHLKNWCTINPRRVRSADLFKYSVADRSTTECTTGLYDWIRPAPVHRHSLLNNTTATRLVRSPRNSRR